MSSFRNISNLTIFCNGIKLSLLPQANADWCSGSTRVSGTRNPGSNPGSAAINECKCVRLFILELIKILVFCQITLGESNKD